MRKSWPFALAVIAVGGIAGVAIAGRPVPSDPFVLDPSITVSIDSAPSSDSATTTTEEQTTTTIATTTTEATTTTVADTSPVTTTTIAATTTVPETTTTLAGPLPRDQVELVIINADGRFRLASITADRLRPLGYGIVLGDTLQTVDATIIYYRPGFDDEAAIVANDILVPDATIAAYPTNAPAISDADDRGNVIVVLGPDAPR